MTPAAATTDVKRRFGDLLAVDGVSFGVHSGEIVGLLGANGAGKTTLIRLLLGVLRPTSGSVELFGGSPHDGARRRLGYMPQGLGLYDDLTAAENLAFTAGVYGVDPPGLGELAAVADVAVADLPLGVRRRVAFAAATSHQPELLILDEPTSGVGPLARAELWDIIHDAADGGTAVLVTTHYMDEAEQCDRLVIMASGREVASGTVDDIAGGLSTAEVEVEDPAAALDLLESAGFQVVPAGHKLRVPGAHRDEVAALVGGSVSTEQASLEEAFMILSRDGDG